MRIPFKIRLFDRFVRFPRYIVVHDISCHKLIAPDIKIDNKSFQTNKLRTVLYKQSMQPDLNYHYVVELIGEDYEVILGRPFAVHCEYSDLKNPYNFSFHVCVMGNFNIDIPERRLYQKICYNVLSPLMKMYRIDYGRVFLHSEISSDKNIKCPGSFFDKNILMNHLKSMKIF